MVKKSVKELLKENMFSIVCFAVTLVFVILTFTLPHYSYTYMFNSKVYDLVGLLNVNKGMLLYIIPIILAVVVEIAVLVLAFIPTDINKKSAIRTTGFVLSIVGAFLGYVMAFLVVLKQGMIPFEFAMVNSQTMEFGHYCLALTGAMVGFTSCYGAARFSD